MSRFTEPTGLRCGRGIFISNKFPDVADDVGPGRHLRTAPPKSLSHDDAIPKLPVTNFHTMWTKVCSRFVMVFDETKAQRGGKKSSNENMR